MVRISLLLVPPAVRVTVIVEEATATLAAVMSPLFWKVTLPAPAWNCHSAGAVRVRVLLVPGAKSVFGPSEITMFPSEAKPDAFVEFCARSAETSFPPIGSVTDTFASSREAQQANKQKIKVNRSVIALAFPGDR